MKCWWWKGKHCARSSGSIQGKLGGQKTAKVQRGWRCESKRKQVKKVALLIQFFSVESESSAGCVCFLGGDTGDGWEGGGGEQGSGPECHSERHTSEGGMKKEGKKGGWGQAHESEGGRIHSEYGGLVLSADSALGFLLVHQPRGAALRLSVPFLLRDVPLWTQRERGVVNSLLFSHLRLKTKVWSVWFCPGSERGLEIPFGKNRGC